MKKEITILHTLQQNWQPVQFIPGAYFVVINEDGNTGACTWLIKQDAGGVFPEHNHPNWTEMILLQGEMTGSEGTFKIGSYQSVAPNIKHGSYTIGKEGMIGLLISEGPIW